MYFYSIIILIFIMLLRLYVETYYLYLTCGTVTVGSFFFLEGHKIVTTSVDNNYRRWKQLNGLISSQYNNVFYLVWCGLVLASKAMYLSALQYFNNSVKRINKNTYEISYLVNGRVYKMLVTPIRGPSRVLQVSDENNEDITDLVVPFLGPRNDWHGRKFTSKDFKRKTLTFELGNGEELTFEEDQELSV